MTNTIIVTTQEEMDSVIADESIVYGTHRIEVHGTKTISVKAHRKLDIWAFGSSRVLVNDSATVQATDSATVWACGSSKVQVDDSATVLACDSSTVLAYGSSKVCAYGSSKVWAYGSSTVWAYGSSTVWATDSSTVWATPQVAVHRSALPHVGVPHISLAGLRTPSETMNTPTTSQERTMTTIPQRFTKRPITIEAAQLTGDTAHWHAIYLWVEANTLGSFEPLDVIEGRKPCPPSGVSIDPRDGRFIISTLEGLHWADEGDWIIRGVQGEFYPCKDAIFRETYEPAAEAMD